MDDRSTSVSIGIAIAFSVLGLFLLICLVQTCSKNIECCKKLKLKKPSIKDNILKKVNVKKPPFSISGIVDKK